MNEFQTVLSAVVPVFVITGAGFAMRRLRWLTGEADHSLVRLTINLLFPCLIIDSMVGNPSVSNLRNLALGPLIGFGTVGLGMLLAQACHRIAGLETVEARRTFTVSVGMYNYGYIPIPLALLLFGQDTVGVVMVHNIGVEIAMWTLGVMVISGAGPRTGFKGLLNAPIIAMMLSLVLDSAGFAPHMPVMMKTTLHLLAQCAIPLCLLLVGATLDDHLEDFHSDMRPRVIATALLLRILVLPAGFLLLAIFLPASIELKRVILLQAAMPAAMFPIVLAKHYGGDPPTALRVVISTSIAGMITIPLWIRFGMHWIK